MQEGDAVVSVSLYMSHEDVAAQQHDCQQVGKMAQEDCVIQVSSVSSCSPVLTG